VNAPAVARTFRRSLACQAAIALGAPVPADGRLAKICFWAARLLFLVSLFLPAVQWRTWSSLNPGPSRLKILFGIQCLLFCVLSPANLSIFFGLYRGRYQRRFPEQGVLISLAGFSCCLGIWCFLDLFRITMRAGFFCWTLVPLLQAVGFAAQLDVGLLMRSGGLPRQRRVFIARRLRNESITASGPPLPAP